MDESLRVEIASVSQIVLARPDKQNAMTAEMGAAIARAVERINQTDAVRVVLVRGEGRAFCAGGDFELIDQNSRRSEEQNRSGMIAFYSSFLSVLEIRVPTIAVLHGATIGAGLSLALACDLRLCAREAKLGANFVRVGLHPGMGCSLLLPRLIGPARAAELMLTGKLVTGEQAEQIGLVHQALPRDRLEQSVSELVEQLLGSAPIAVAQTKATLLEPLRAALPAALEREASAQAVGFASSDLGEAVAAFREGRAPRFQGR